MAVVGVRGAPGAAISQPIISSVPELDGAILKPPHMSRPADPAP